MGWWVAELLEHNPAELVSRIVVVLGSIVLHELAHGWAAIRAGDRTPIETGHMTWNPLVHMGPMSLLFFFLVGFAWGQMPVNPSRFRRWDDRAFVAAAGPAMNLALAVVFMIALALTPAPPGSQFTQNLFVFFWTGAVMNVVLMTLNLLPIPPLDGSAILATYSRSYARVMGSPQGANIALALMVAVFLFGSRYLFGAARTAVQHGTDLIGQMLP